MKIVILSGSPKDERSVTLQVGKYIEKISEFSFKDEFTELLIGNGKYTKEIGEKIKQADLVMFCGSPFHACVPSQMIGFLDELGNDIKEDVQGKPVTFFSTSSQIMDFCIHGYMESALKKIGFFYIRGLSLVDTDILNKKGQEETANWYHYVRSYVTDRKEKFKDNNSKIVLLDSTDGKNDKINRELENTIKYFESSGSNEIVTIKLREYKIKPCTACVYCYSKEDCINKDDFSTLCDTVYKKTSIIINFGELSNGLIGEVHKRWMDRHVKYGLRPHNDELIFSYILDMSNSTVEDKVIFNQHETEINNFNGDYHVGLCDIDDKKQIEEYYQDIIKIYNYELYPQRNFFSRASDFMFKDIAWKIQKVAPGNYEYFKNKDNGYKLEPLNIHIQGFSDYKGAIESSKRRLTPYKMLMQSITEDPGLKTKRRIHNRWNEEKSMQAYEEKESFFKRLLKKFKRG